MAGMTVKWLVLLVITLQTTALVLVLRYSRANTSGPPYLASSAVLLTELAKSAAVLFTLWLEHDCSVSVAAVVVRRQVLGKPWDTLRLSVPSFLYTIQNNLQYVALTNLDAATFQVLYQLKILMTALMSALMLNRRVLPHQWASLVLLVAGVCLVQVPAEDSGPERGSRLLGLAAVLASSVTSGYSGVYFERIVKQTTPQGTSLALRNVQLSLFSVPFGMLAVIINDGAAVAEAGFFQGYTGYTWIVILLQAFGGLAVSISMKYADNILKGFATSISILLSALLSWWLLEEVRPSWRLAAGAVLVVAATCGYGYRPAPSRPRPAD